MSKENTWIQTYTGKQFWPLNPNKEAICIEDIAHALSMICRFNGHSKHFYSVAEHSVLVSKNVNPVYAFDGLMHDSAEAYISDLGKPVKNEINGYENIESNLKQAIYEKFKIYDFDNWAVKEVDERILVDEMEQLMPNQPDDWGHKVDKLGIDLMFLNPEQAEVEFLKRFYEVQNEN